MIIINERERNRTRTTPSEASAAARSRHGMLKTMKAAMADVLRTLNKFFLFVCAAVLIVTDPVVNFGLGWLGGWALKMCFGPMIADGLNLLFDTTRFTPEFIPLACATLATIGHYFKSSQTIRKD